ncbi:MAG: hypothetical protein ACLUNS_00090 [Alistipes shahii]
MREETIDLKVQHILQSLIAFGFFDRDQRDASIPEQDAVSREAALQLAREGIVLLKNDNGLLLPCAEAGSPSQAPTPHGS